MRLILLGHWSVLPALGRSAVAMRPWCVAALWQRWKAAVKFLGDRSRGRGVDVAVHAELAAAGVCIRPLSG
jgi:hypothetical protein